MKRGSLLERFSRLRRKRRRHGAELPPDLAGEAEFAQAYERCRAYTMTSPERMYALWSAVRYVSRARVAGDWVECGVWKGGSSMLAALALQAAGDVSRTLWLYDTFTGMTEPTDRDVDLSGRPARARFERASAASCTGSTPSRACRSSARATTAAPGPTW